MSALLSLATLVPPALAQEPVTLPAGTQLTVSTPERLPMKAGEPVRAELLYPVYQDNKLVLPTSTTVVGTVVKLTSNHSHRLHSRFHGDFTPFYTPVLSFTAIALPDGTLVPIATGTATDGAPIYRVVSPKPVHGGLLTRQIAKLKQAAKDQVAVITGPDKRDRLIQLLYAQLPYHPQRIERSTAWMLETQAPVLLPNQASAIALQAPTKNALAPPEGQPVRWILEARLTNAISSASSTVDQPITATVAEPILNRDGTIAVPQGSVLTGSVTQARPARRFARSGVLRFTFRQLAFPDQEQQAVRATLTGADSSASQNLEIDREGVLKPKPPGKLMPLILLALAVAPLHQEEENGAAENPIGKDAAASNSLGLIGFIVGTAAQQPNVAAGFGFYGAALSIYEHFLTKGKEVSFARGTRIVLETAPTRATAMKHLTPAQ